MAIPPGLFDHEMQFRIKDAMQELVVIENRSILRTIAQIGHARVMLVQLVGKPAE